jgi:hypothetical protein
MIWMRHGNLLVQKLQSLEDYELERFAFQHYPNLPGWVGNSLHDFQSSLNLGFSFLLVCGFLMWVSQLVQEKVDKSVIFSRSWNACMIWCPHRCNASPKYFDVLCHEDQPVSWKSALELHKGTMLNGQMLQRVAEAWGPGRNKERTPRSLAKPGRSKLRAYLRMPMRLVGSL